MVSCRDAAITTKQNVLLTTDLRLSSLVCGGTVERNSKRTGLNMCGATRLKKWLSTLRSKCMRMWPFWLLFGSAAQASFKRAFSFYRDCSGHCTSSCVSVYRSFKINQLRNFAFVTNEVIFTVVLRRKTRFDFSNMQWQDFCLHCGRRFDLIEKSEYFMGWDSQNFGSVFKKLNSWRACT